MMENHAKEWGEYIGVIPCVCRIKMRENPSTHRKGGGMAVSASLKVTSNTTFSIKITEMNQVDDDAEWSAPSVGDVFTQGQEFTVAMGNESFPPFLKGCGVDLSFIVLGGDTPSLRCIWRSRPWVNTRSTMVRRTPTWCGKTTRTSA